MTKNQPAVINFSSAPMSVEIREIEIPEIGPDDTLMQVAAVGVCGSDLHQWAGVHSWPVNYSVTLGHEFAGVLVKTGANVTGFKEGDRVCSETAAIIDANSPMTRIGKYNLDPNRKGFGYGTHGAMTHYVKVPARCLHRVPDTLPLRLAALTEPCCVAFSAVVSNVNILPGDRVAVLGPGPIGLLCGAIARLRGAEVAVVGLPQDKVRLDLAKELGCTALFNDSVPQRSGCAGPVKSNSKSTDAWQKNESTTFDPTCQKSNAAKPVKSLRATGPSASPSSGIPTPAKAP